MNYEKLAKGHWVKHDYMLYVYDILGDMLRKADSLELSNLELHFDNEEQAVSFEQSDDIYSWLDNHGRHEEALKHFTLHTFFMLLRDFEYYIYESLSCISRGKVTVAFTLLRKPIRDNLLYLEWLLADPNELYHAFFHGEVDQYDVSNFNTFSKERIKRIINNASEKSYLGYSLNTDNLIYDLRFDSKSDIGLQRIWNQSMHLVTTAKHYKTNKSNLNFVFSDVEEWDEYWNYYYLVMPQLLAYTIEICEAHFINILPVDNLNLIFNRIIRLSKYFEIQSEEVKNTNCLDSKIELYDLINSDDYLVSYNCEHCNGTNPLSKELIDKFIKDYYFTCCKCNSEIRVSKYYTELQVQNK